MKLILLLATAIGGVTPAPSAPDQSDPETWGARQVVGLFSSACLQFAGQRDQMRVALDHRGVPKLTPQARAIFMQDRPGVGYDATTGTTRLALISEENGVCTAIGEHADSSRVLALLTGLLQANQIAFDLRQEHDNPPGLHHRDYVVTIRGQKFNMVVSTAAPGKGMEAQVTLSPRSLREGP